MALLRDYKFDTPQYLFYKEQHEIQTYDYVIKKMSQYAGNNRTSMTMHRALELMDSFIDPSDPDATNENSIHAYQTAERMRKAHPDNRELQVSGLIHDLGKVLFSFGEPSIAVVGDTYAVGCEFPASIVYYDTMKANPDSNHAVYSTPNGIYQPGCGIENLTITFGHDEYLYRVLQTNLNHKLSKRYQNMIRFHSFYPWHTGKEYVHFMREGDDELMKDVLEFNKYDLYSKEDTDFILTDEIRQYYTELLNEYFPEPLLFPICSSS
jgi:inositol oxygenase